MGDQDDFATYRERPFVLAYNGHARTLLEGGTDLNSAMGWTVRYLTSLNYLLLLK